MSAASLSAPGSRAGRPVLITGGAGFLGANLADRLAGEGHAVIVLDSLVRPGVAANLDWLCRRHGDRIVPVRADVRDRDAVRSAIAASAAVCHLAAQVAVTTSIADPVADFEINARGTLEVLEALRREADPPPLLFASTNKVYGAALPHGALTLEGRSWLPARAEARRGIAETAPLDLQSPYGCSKGVADQYVLDYARVYGLPTAVLRMSCLYGQRQFGTEDQGWVAHFLFATLQGRPITLYGDGCQVRDVLAVEDAVAAWIGALYRFDAVRGRAFNLGGGPRHAASLLDMLAAIERLTGIGPRIAHADWRAGDQRWYVSDTSALERAIGWRPTIGIEDGLERLLAWAEERRDDAGATPELRPGMVMAAPRRVRVA